MVEIKNNTKMIQLLEEKEEGINWMKKILRTRKKNKSNENWEEK